MTRRDTSKPAANRDALVISMAARGRGSGRRGAAGAAAGAAPSAMLPGAARRGGAAALLLLLRTNGQGPAAAVAAQVSPSAGAARVRCGVREAAAQRCPRGGSEGAGSGLGRCHLSA